MTRESFLRRVDKKHGTPSHARAPKQEAETAKRFGGKLTPGSGNKAEKGDVRIKGVARIENKTTKNKSFSITREMVQKIENAAMPCGEVPIIVVEFNDGCGGVDCDVAIMPMYALDILLSR